MINLNPMQLMNAMRSENPQQMVMNMLRQNANGNPILTNALNMAEKGDYKGVENLARNLCNEKNINPDNAINELKSQFGVCQK